MMTQFKWTVAWKTAVSAMIGVIVSLSVTRVGPEASGRSETYRGTQIIKRFELDVKSMPDQERGNDLTDRYGRDSVSKVVIFDGGSTGTRLHVFSFKTTAEADRKRIRRRGGTNRHRPESVVTLESEYFEMVMPGLSSYAGEPQAAVVSIQPLLDKAMTLVPERTRSSTPILLKATAGLRLLPGQQADEILDVVEREIRSMQPAAFYLPDGGVSVLSGDDEGIFSWFTINFLLNRVQDHDRSVAVVDLGGGSTQITFAPSYEDESPDGYVIKKSIMGREQDIYTHSYLGYGLMSTRKSILCNGTESRCPETSGEIRLKHPCFPAIPDQVNWFFENVTYWINGVTSPTAFEECVNATNQFVRSGNIHAPSELNSRTIYGVSYYFDRIYDVGLIADKHAGRTVKVGDYYRLAQEVCGDRRLEKEDQQQQPNPATSRKPATNEWRTKLDSRFNTKNWRPRSGSSSTHGGRLLRPEVMASLLESHPFLCLDLAYISSLLTVGFGLNSDNDMTLVKKIDGIETSWALGAAFNMLKFN